VAERLALSGSYDVVGETSGLRLEIGDREAGLLGLGETVLRRHVVDVAEVLDRVVHGREF
jgi:hypothetical protein